MEDDDGEVLLGNNQNEIHLQPLSPGSIVMGITDHLLDLFPPYYMREADIVLNSDWLYRWEFTYTQVDSTFVEANLTYHGLVAHEIGHALGLAHTTDRLTVMTNVDWNGSYNHGRLHADDHNAMRSLYPSATGPLATDLEAGAWHTVADFVSGQWVAEGTWNQVAWAHWEGLQPVVPVAANDFANVEITVENFGNDFLRTAALSFFFSDDQTMSPETDSQYYVTTFGQIEPAIGDASKNPSEHRSVFVQMPCFNTARSVFIWYEIDREQVLLEDLENNNRRFITHGGLPVRFDIQALLPGESCIPGGGGPAAPGPPIGFNASDSFCFECKLTWQAPITGGLPRAYRVFRGAQQIGEFAADSPDYCPGGSCTFWDEGGPGTRDYYAVAFNDSGTAQSAVEQGTIIENSLPVPQNILASTDRCDGVMVTWDWPAGTTNPDSFYIYRGSLFPWIARIAGDRRSFLDPGPGTNTPTNYYVRAVTYSNRCQRQGGSTAPGVKLAQLTGGPTILAVSGRCDGVELTWTYTTTGWNEWGYEVFRDSTGASIGPLVHSTSDRADTSWLDTGASPGVHYNYRVRATPPPAYVCNPTLHSTAAAGRRTSNRLTILTNIAGAVLTDNGVQATIEPAGYVVPCSVLSVTPERTLETPATQYIDGAKYCFDSWSDGGFRSHTVTVTIDTTITLNLIPSGSGPTTYQAGALVPPDLSDCRSPHVFEGSASAPNGLTVHPGTTLRFPYDPNGPAYAGLNVQRHLYATDATFETVDGASNDKVGAWLGISYTDPFSVLSLQRCAVRNAVSGVARSAGTVSTAAIDSCTFAKNNFDLVLEFEESATPGQSAHLFRNFFTAQRAVQIIGAELTGSAPVAADIDYNTFASSSNNSTCLSLTGGFSGHVNSNVLNMGNTGNIGVEMAARGALYPAVSFTGNLFQFATPQRTCMIAPTVSGHPYLSAVYNNWNQSAASDIESMIYHYKDTASKAEVVFEPFTTPPGGGGGGGGGCPFVLSRQPDGSYLIENSILGASELGSGELRSVTDAYPLRHVHIEEHGRVNLRIAEFEPETDYLDHVGLTALTIPDGADIGVDPGGGLVVFRPIPESAQVVSWTGRNAPYISPIAGQAFTGEPGDSLEFEVKAALPPGMPISRRFNIAMIPKPQEAPAIRGDRVGVTVRVAGSGSHNWVTLGPLVPRALWSNAVLPLELPAGASPDRVRIVWNTQHALGWAGLVEVVEPLSRVELPCRGAVRSTGGDESASLARVDGVGATLETGQHIDLSFDAASAPERARFVLSSTGRYVLATRQAPGVPSVAYAEQNSPNPFNPRTEIRYGVPAAMRVRILVYDVSGRLVRSILDRVMAPGHHTASWDGTGVGGGRVASGVYFYEVRAGSFAARRRMVLLR